MVLSLPFRFVRCAAVITSGAVLIGWVEPSPAQPIPIGNPSFEESVLVYPGLANDGAYVVGGEMPSWTFS